MGTVVKCRLNTCQKPLTEKMEIEYSQTLNDFFCCPDHATDFYFDYMASTPLDKSIDDREDVYFANGKLYLKD